MPLYNNFVDLVSAQSVGGIKTLLSNLLFNPSTMVIRADAANKRIQIAGGAGTGGSDGATLELCSDGSGSGSATIYAGNNGSARITERLSNANSSWQVKDVSNNQLWYIQHNGDLVQNGTFGGNLKLNKLTASTPLYLDSSKNVTNDADATTISGWIPLNQTWTYASASSFTVPGDQTAIFTKGTPLKFTNSTTKYANVASSSYSAPNTTVNIIVNTDYTIANTTITSPQISRGSPSDFPYWFNYTPTFTGFSVDPTSVFSQYRVDMNTAYVVHRENAAGTSNSTDFHVSLPVTAVSIGGAYWGSPCWSAADNGSPIETALVYIAGGGSNILLAKSVTSANWTNSGQKRADWEIFYRF